jgi:hypothetical protein
MKIRGKRLLSIMSFKNEDLLAKNREYQIILSPRQFILTFT